MTTLSDDDRALLRSELLLELLTLLPNLAGPASTPTFEVVGDVELPIGARDLTWDAQAASETVAAECPGDGDAIDPDCFGRAFLYRDPDADPAARGSYSLGFADVIDGELRVVPAGVFAVAGSLAEGVDGIPDAEQEMLRAIVSGLYTRMAEAFDDPTLVAPWDEPDDDTASSSSMAHLDGEIEVTGTTGDLPSTFRTILATEEELTGDRRILSEGGLTWRELPLPLTMSHSDNAFEVVGRVDSIERDGRRIIGEGTFDLDGENGREAARLVRDGFLRGVSIEPVDVVSELECDGDDCVERLVSGRIAVLSIVTRPAIESARIEAVVAAAAVLEAIGTMPPASHFDDPGFTEATPITVDLDGRISGHAAAWGSCHTGYPDICKTAPSSVSGYAFFLTGEILTADVDGGHVRVPVGQITLGTGHAPLSMTAASASAHYDNTGTAVADVAVGEDAHGIWVSGSVRPDVDETQLRALMGASLSGDWRPIRGTLELVAWLCVNVPGFPVPRVSARLADGQPVALVAAGIVEQSGCGCDTAAQLDALGHRLGNVEAVLSALGLSAQAIDALAAAISSER